MVRDWSTSPSMTWQPTAAGPYTVAVWARNAGVTVDANEALAYVTYDISSSSTPVSTPSPNPTQPTLWSLTSNLVSPQVPGTTVTFSAAASGGTAPYQYKWWVSDGTSWSVVRDWNTSASMTWRPTTAGIYTVAVWARNAGVAADTAQAMEQTTYAITSNGLMPLVVTGLSSSVSSPRSVGDTVDFTASASGGSGSYQFKWWVWDGSVWAVAQSWSLSPNLTWRPTGAGTYMVAVWVRNLGVIVDASEALAQVPYIVTP